MDMKTYVMYFKISIRSYVEPGVDVCLLAGTVSLHSLPKDVTHAINAALTRHAGKVTEVTLSFLQYKPNVIVPS